MAMISLRTELESADRLDRQRRELTRYYLSAIEICAKYAIEVPTETNPVKAEATGARASQLKPQEALQAAVQLSSLYNALLQDASPEALAHSLVDFENCIRGHSEALRDALAGANQDVRLVLELLR